MSELTSKSPDDDILLTRTDDIDSNKLTGVYDAVSKDFLVVNELIPKLLSSEVDLVEEIGRYIVEAGGKRFRPLLVLLTSGLFDTKTTDANKLAIVIEFLHTATLLHDDVVDKSALRRGRLTANEKWGNPPSVLVGDFLYSRAFQLMVEIGNLNIMKILSDATNLIAEGEVMQLANLGNFSLSVDSYRKVINCKTALLFESATHSAGVLAMSKSPKVKEEQVKSIRSYGHHFGMAYQLIDDLLDYVGSKTIMGKNTGDDLSEGKLTLPIILALAKTTGREKNSLLHALKQKSSANLEEIVEIITSSGAIEDTRKAALHEIEQAREHLLHLPENEYRKALESLTEYSADRIF